MFILKPLEIFGRFMSVSLSAFCCTILGNDDQTDNWDSRPSNPVSNWTFTDQTGKSRPDSPNAVWICSSVGRERLFRCEAENRSQPVHLPVTFSFSHAKQFFSEKQRKKKQLSVSEQIFISTESKSNRRDFRSYDRAWQIHPKKPKKSKSDLAVSNISPPSSESKSRK